jgi:hypothetical protein
VAADPWLDDIFQEVFASRRGQQLALKPPQQAYGLRANTPPLPWGQVAEAVRNGGDTLLGLVPCGGEPQLALDRQRLVALRPKDALVVLTRRWCA